MTRKLTVTAMLLLGLPFAVSPLRAQDGGKDKESSKESGTKDAAGKDKVRMPTEREQAALGFVLLNHPDLVEVLNRLKASNRAEYDKAIRQIEQTSDRLTKLSKDDPELHELELRLWKVNSRLQLLAAQMSVNASSAANDELKQAVREEFDAKADLLALEHKRQTAQLKKLDAEMARINQSRDKEIEARVNELKKEIARMKRKSKPPPTASSSTPSTDPKSKTTP